MQENITVGQWREKYKSLCRARNVNESNYAGFAYDAVWTYALALNNLVKENQSLLSDIHSSVSTQWVFLNHFNMMLCFVEVNSWACSDIADDL